MVNLYQCYLGRDRLGWLRRISLQIRIVKLQRHYGKKLRAQSVVVHSFYWQKCHPSRKQESYSVFVIRWTTLVMTNFCCFTLATNHKTYNFRMTRSLNLTSKILATTNVWHSLDFKKCTYRNIRCSQGSVCDGEESFMFSVKTYVFSMLVQRHGTFVRQACCSCYQHDNKWSVGLHLRNSQSSYSTMEPSATKTQESRILRGCSSQKGSTTG